MPQYRSAGKVPPKRHTQLCERDGKLAFEEMFTTRDFGDIYSLLYQAKPSRRVALRSKGAKP